MPGFATFEPQPAALSSNAVPVLVFRLVDEDYQILPNIRCLSISSKIGADAGEARFRYAFDPGGVFGDPAWPSTPEDVLDPTASGPYVVRSDDRITVFGVTAEGDQRILFDGFALIPAGSYGSRESTVEFVAKATPFRCGDEPIWHCAYRNADDPTNPKATVDIDLPIVFNPDGLANATKDGADAVSSAVMDDPPMFPVFLDPVYLVDRPDDGRLWSLAMAVRHVLVNYNDETYVDSGNLDANDQTLIGINPVVPGGLIDPNDPTTFTTGPIIIREFDATGYDWPVALEKLLTPYGFAFLFDLSLDPSDQPNWEVKVFRVTDPGFPITSVYLQPEGDYLDPALTNVLTFQLVRDAARTRNDWKVQSALERHEIAAVLAPGFYIEGVNADNPALYNLADESGLASGDDDARDLDSYRVYVFDETGEYHWDFSIGTEVIGQATSLAKVLAPDGIDEMTYAKWRRVPSAHLLTTDSTGKPRPALLLLSWDYAGPSPGVWDGTGHWYEAGDAWTLLDDRIGIRLTANSVESWQTGNKAISFGVTKKSTAGLVKGVSAQAILAEKHFTLMLVTVIEGDAVLFASAPKRAAVPTQFTTRAYIDAADKYRLDSVTKGSWYNQKGDTDKITRDDTKAAQFDAAQRQAANEMPPLTGSITIGRLVNSYSLGLRLLSIEGRDLSLQTNVQVANERPTYPMVVGIDYELDGGQRTVLHLHDQRSNDVAR